jgi:hypothetical protein
MQSLGISDVRLEPYRGAPSTYRPYALAFGAALLGTLLVWIVAGRGMMALVAAALEAFALVMCLHADRTPFSPGANDNASGVGVLLGLAARLAEESLAHTEVWLAFTGCEDVAAYGVPALLDAHAPELGDDAVYLILDQVGLGQLRVLTAHGLIIKRTTHPHALELSRRPPRPSPTCPCTRMWASPTPTLP